ncbi:MAG: tRNA (5-methylaminomethyl-2-thiouridine)(34)-methyltransferase MnmD [Rubripirellula sp.]|nr:tRNA (5-methylaminomethyl-2-thiouridine)(34)-methyltransferase MnmD [Rubripirellula sp.]
MRRHRPTIPILGTPWSVQITDDQSRTLIDPLTGVAFHSASGGLAETKHVYLHNSGVSERLQSRQPTAVLEVGLGLGLGLLATLDAAIDYQCELRYVGIEKEWLAGEILEHLKLDDFLNKPSLAADFCSWRKSLGKEVPEGRYEREFGPLQHVTIEHTDATDWDPQDEEKFDAVYFDPFAPDVNPELWSTSFFKRMQEVLKPGGKLVTYCVNRKVRQTLSDAGFTPKRVPGPIGGKREVMVAEF